MSLSSAKNKSKKVFCLSTLCSCAYDCKLIMVSWDLCWHAYVVSLITHTTHWFLNFSFTLFFLTVSHSCMLSFVTTRLTPCGIFTKHP